MPATQITTAEPRKIASRTTDDSEDMQVLPVLLFSDGGDRGEQGGEDGHQEGAAGTKTAAAAASRLCCHRCCDSVRSGHMPLSACSPAASAKASSAGTSSRRRRAGMA